MDSSDNLIGTIFDGRYRIVRQIGLGGMAKVYLADDQTLGRQVAIKILDHRHAADVGFVERFMREAQSAAKLNHPNIVQVYDRGRVDDAYYIAMEFVDGVTLKDLVRSRGPLEEAEVIAYGRQAGSALRFAHRNGIVHRDIKPQNMLIDAEGRLKIADFGIARAGADAGLTEVGSIVGTAQYLSPEQARGQTVSATSDLYSLGVVLFEMATGRVPFDGDNPVNVALRHVNEQAPRPSMIRPGLSPALEAVILRSLQKEPSQRYQTADELLADLEAARGGTVSSHTAAMTAVLPQAATVVQPLVPPISRDAGNGYAAARDSYIDNYERDSEDQKSSKWWIWLLVLALLLGGVGAWYFTAGPGGGKSKKTPTTTTAKKITVPDVTNKQGDTAIALLRDKGFQTTTPQLAASDIVPKGAVISQNPDGGTQAAVGAQVDLIVSSGKATKPMPDVVGKSEADARQTLAEAGFDDANIRSTSGFSDKPKGTVVSETPKAGTDAAADQKILLVISKGPEQVAVPNVVNLSDAAATTKLRAAGFLVDHTTPQDDKADKGTVLAQSPTSGGSTDKGSTVTLTLATGFNAVPDVTAMSPSQADVAITDAGFTPCGPSSSGCTPVGTTSVGVGMAPGDPDRISHQSPAGGQRRAVGSTVSYDVEHA